ncbi:hypothetical protein CK203_116837 [Vitis vinifera]|uniref:Uncharacterized protein n=1 Tax=Vitis vinifera TaxID=29760 RepID=A0A438CVV4_VITVI|nr:hypothetical protein CK203_116837 [Vitis vinifera]
MSKMAEKLSAVSEEEVLAALSDLKGDKAPGPDRLYKILAKVLANRLTKVVCKVVSKFQNAFVETRRMGDWELGGLTHSTRLFLASGFDGSKWRYRIGLWKAIRKLWAMFVTKVSFFVGEGKRVKFWKDRWCGSESSCNSFPSLYALASSKKAWVANMWDSLLVVVVVRLLILKESK